jgi:hypothetical protein
MFIFNKCNQFVVLIWTKIVGRDRDFDQYNIATAPKQKALTYRLILGLIFKTKAFLRSESNEFFDRKSVAKI